ncbi:hypothetical protein [Streptomyces olivaceiscleroticus]|uniref:Cyclodipeptide synthase n=1 Tax=Streptomyces olivaceiscleroticus TaxID=68245 RepID=A0ABP3KKF4_9ACTN
MPLVETAVEVLFRDGEQVTAAYPGSLGHLRRGSVGRSVTVDLAGGSSELMIPEVSGALASLRFAFSLERLEPAAALRLLRIRQRIVAGGAFEVRAAARVIGGGNLPPQPEAARQAAHLRTYIEDLEVVQRHCEHYFPVPTELTAVDRIALRMARLLIEGYCVISPFLPRARFTLNGQDSPTLRALLSGEPHAIQGGSPAYAITVAGRHLNLGAVRFYHPHTTADREDSQRALAAVEAGHGAGCKVTVRPHRNPHFRLMLRNTAPRAGWDPAPLGLPGFAEPR